ncbi:type IIL restriction-modification enzyme MmeI [Corynebacterium sp. NML98-0116]|uniref:type IIL restriction-modification enzyme MmeI n=1 Tax=Corynebacterium sp. NML98-0116 TaxID=702967 RepID=UPI00352D1487
MNGDPVPVKVDTGINAYLIDGINVLVEKSRKVLSPEIAVAVMGNMARDGGNLIVEPEEYETIYADEVARKYLRPFVGSREIVQGKDRWCLWMTDLEPADLSRSSLLSSRLQAVREFRSASKAASTRQMAETPQLFGQRSQPETDYLAVPKVVSETRRYYTAQRYPSNVVVSDLAYHVQDQNGLQFALISSSMFIAWQKAVGGRLKSDLRFSNTLTWNTFPVPELTEDQRQRIIKAGKGVLEARALHPERSLAEHYEPLAMAPELIKAHNALDREVDKAFGASKRLTSERQRQELLFSNYVALTK